MYPRTRIAHPNRNLLIVLCIAIILAVIGFLTYASLRFHVTGTTPQTKGLSIYTPTFTIHTNKVLDAKGTSTPVANENIISSSTVKGRDIEIKIIFPLSEKKTYTITVNSIRAADGSQLINKVFTLQPKDVPYDKLSPKEQKNLIDGQDRPTAIQSDPLLSHLPYSSLNFNLTGVIRADASGKAVVEVDAELLPSAADVKSGNESQVIEQYKQEVLAYIRSVGLDPANYPIVYVVTEPSLY